MYMNGISNCSVCGDAVLSCDISPGKDVQHGAWVIPNLEKSREVSYKSGVLVFTVRAGTKLVPTFANVAQHVLIMEHEAGAASMNKDSSILVPVMV